MTGSMQLLHLSIVGDWTIRTARLLDGSFLSIALGPQLPLIDDGNIIRRGCAASAAYPGCPTCAALAADDHQSLVAIAKIWGQP